MLAALTINTLSTVQRRCQAGRTGIHTTPSKPPIPTSHPFPFSTIPKSQSPTPPTLKDPTNPSPTSNDSFFRLRYPRYDISPPGVTVTIHSLLHFISELKVVIELDVEEDAEVREERYHSLGFGVDRTALRNFDAPNLEEGIGFEVKCYWAWRWTTSADIDPIISRNGIPGLTALIRDALMHVLGSTYPHI